MSGREAPFASACARPRAPSIGSKASTATSSSRSAVFTFAWEDVEGKPSHQTLVTVTFAERGDKTELTLHQAVFETVEARDSHRRGWTSTLQRFAEHLAENR
jgi:hypothetical protein